MKLGYARVLCGRKEHDPSRPDPGATLPSLHLPSGAVLQRFREVVGLDDLGAVEVGDGAGEFEVAVEGAGAELKLAHGGFDQRLAIHLLALIGKAACFLIEARR